MTTSIRDQPQIWYEAYKFDDKRFIYLVKRKAISWRGQKIKGFNGETYGYIEVFPKEEKYFGYKVTDYKNWNIINDSPNKFCFGGEINNRKVSGNFLGIKIDECSLFTPDRIQHICENIIVPHLDYIAKNKGWD